MRVVVDCVMYGLQLFGGIPRIFNEILPRMCDLDESLIIELLSTVRLKQPLPFHSRIFHKTIPVIERYLRPQRIFKSLYPWVKDQVQNLWIGGGKDKIWHSTYFTLPKRWEGQSVVTVYDMIYEIHPEWSRFPDREQIIERKQRCIKAADCIICISQSTKYDLLKCYNLEASKVQVIYNAYSEVFKPLVSYDNLWEPPIGKPFLLYLGFRAGYKNFSTLLKTYSLWPRRSEVALVVIGSPWTEHEQRQLQSMKVAENVILINNEIVDDHELSRFYNQAQAFVYPSLYEGFGIPLLEAMACGCPVIASRISSTEEVADKNVIYFEPTHVDSLMDAMDLALDQGKDNPQVHIAREWVKQYSWDKTAKATLDVYKSLSV
jgi:glycosyltransferase involved in cell wall biosynthesis